MKSGYEVRAQKFVKQIFPYLINCQNHDQRESAIISFNLQNKRHVYYAHGQSRYALITSDYVIKVDYRETCWGNSEDEIRMYAQAEQDGFSYLFAKITRFDYNGISFYIMPRIHNIGSHCGDAKHYMTRNERAWCHKQGLYDLHRHNYGWENDHVVIIDYAAHF